MSKLLKAVAKAHRPHIAAKMTKENGYDESKHLHPHHLHEAGIINDTERKDLDECIGELADGGDNAGMALRAALAGELNEGKLNSKTFMDSIGVTDSDEDEDDGDDVDDDADDLSPTDDPADADGKVTA